MALRTEKKRAARAAMQQAALELVAERGFASVTVEDIAAAAGVSTRTFFNYFATKEESLFSISSHALRQVVRDLEQRPPGEHPFASMRHVVRLLVAHVEEDPVQTRLRHVVAAREPRLVTHLLAPYAEFEALAAGIIQRRATAQGSPVPAELIVSACVAALFAAIRLWSTSGDGRPLHRICDEHLDLLERGLGQPASAGRR